MSKLLEEDSTSLEVWELSGYLDFSWQQYLITQTYFLFFPILISYLPFENLMDELLEEMHGAGQVSHSSLDCFCLSCRLSFECSSFHK